MSNRYAEFNRQYVFDLDALSWEGCAHLIIQVDKKREMVKSCAEKQQFLIGLAFHLRARKDHDQQFSFGGIEIDWMALSLRGRASVEVPRISCPGWHRRHHGEVAARAASIGGSTHGA